MLSNRLIFATFKTEKKSVHHSCLILFEFSLRKIRNSCHLENLQKFLLFETLGNTFELMTAFERKNNLIHNRFAHALLNVENS